MPAGVREQRCPLLQGRRTRSACLRGSQMHATCGSCSAAQRKYRDLTHMDSTEKHGTPQRGAAPRSRLHWKVWVPWRDVTFGSVKLLPGRNGTASSPLAAPKPDIEVEGRDMVEGQGVRSTFTRRLRDVQCSSSSCRSLLSWSPRSWAGLGRAGPTPTRPLVTASEGHIHRKVDTTTPPLTGEFAFVRSRRYAVSAETRRLETGECAATGCLTRFDSANMSWTCRQSVLPLWHAGPGPPAVVPRVAPCPCCGRNWAFRNSWRRSHELCGTGLRNLIL